MKVGVQQQPASFLSLLQSHEGLPPYSMLLIMAEAQPTPELTVIAPNSQLRAQAPHSMHKSLSVMAAFLSESLKTP